MHPDPGTNPYDWRRHRPRVEIIRPGVDDVAADLGRGGSAVLIAGRGLGKSVFLRQLQSRLEREPGVVPVLLSAPPAELTVRELIRELARRLEVDAGDASGVHEVFQKWLDERGSGQRAVLLYDELDRYGKSAASPAHPPGRDFFNNLELARRDFPELGALAAGSIGVFNFRDSLGSSFLARANRIRIHPFDLDDMSRLTRPFSEQGRPLSGEVLEALFLATGGNPALVTYGLESLWPQPSAGVDEVTEIYAGFRLEHAEFLNDFQRSFSDPALSEAPQQIWELIQKAEGPISHADLEAASQSKNGILRLDFRDVLDLLEAAGLVRIAGSVAADPVTVRPIASILSLPRTPSTAARIADRLRSDLGHLLARLHASAADFFRPGTGGGGKQLVPESVFASFLALGFELLGWQAVREAQSVAGRADLQLRWNGGEELAIVELKIWGRGDYRTAHRQAESYWSDQVAAGAVVMLTDSEISNWPRVYRESCLDPLHVTVDEPPETSLPIRAQFECPSNTVDGVAVRIDHFLVRVPRGR